jgi:hypothetical protein
MRFGIMLLIAERLEARVAHERCWIVLSEWGEHSIFGRDSDPDEGMLRAMAADLRIQAAGGWLAVLEGDYHGDGPLSLLMVRELAPARVHWSDAEAAFLRIREGRRAACCPSKASDDAAFVTGVYSLATDRDLSRLGGLLTFRPDFNAIRIQGSPILDEVLLALNPEDPRRFEVVGFILDQGLDAHALDEESMSCLGTPLARSDYDMVCFLLDRGVDPNHGIAFDETITVYDWAKADYRLDTGMFSYPDHPSFNGDEAVFLEGMDRWAIKFNRPRPTHLIRMREKGALTTREMASRLGSPEARIKWVAGWQVASENRSCSPIAE